MGSLLAGFDSFIGIVRVATIAVVGVLGVLCLIGWAVRTRKVTPFSSLARFSRARIDPLIAPMERRVVRAGGLPSSAPLWTFLAAVIAAILLISLLNFLRNGVVGAAYALSQGSAGFYVLLVTWTFAILRTALLVRVISSWLPISPYSPWLRWAFVLSEPILRPLRQIVPNLGMIDITPIIAYFLLGLLKSVMLGMV